MRSLLFFLCVLGVAAASLVPDSTQLKHLKETCLAQLESADGGIGEAAVQKAAAAVAQQLNIKKEAVLPACLIADVERALHGRRLQQNDDDDAWDQGIASVQPRLSINAISNRDDEDMYKIMYLMAMEQFMYHTKQTGNYAYYAIAAIHGLHFDYNQQTPPGEQGWCKHDHAQFPTWHRPYMRLYELGLQKSCYKVANRFVDEEMRLAGNRTCAILRAPWWDIVKGETPGILQRKTVMVYNKDGTELTEKRNPLRKYCFKTDTASNKEGSKSAGDCVNRSKSWASAMRNLAANTATALKAFYRGPWACTNTWQGNGCSGNLEGTHNTWHQAIGGDVVWLAWATYDPLFWLFHMAMDRYLYLWQIASNGNEYVGGNQYKPFPKAVACGAKIKSCGVSYGSHKTGSQNKKSTSLKAMRVMSDDEVALELLGSVADTSGDDAMSPQAIAYLAEALQELPHNPDTFEWNAVFNRLDPNALKDRTFSLHVFLNNRGSQGLGQLPYTDSGRIDVTELHLREDYCGSYGGFVTYMGDMPGHIHKNRTVPVPLSPCLKRNGVFTNIAAKNPSDPTAGPVHLPVKRSDLTVLCVDGHGKDCTKVIRHSYALGLGWQAMTDQYNPASQMFTSPAEGAHIASIAALGPAAEAQLYTLGLQKPERVIPDLKYLHVAQVDEF